MTTNRLAKSEVQPKRTAQEWCDLGNERLRGLRPYEGKKFQGYAPRDDIEWVVENGQPRLRCKIKSA
jgi:hypothetical protein